MRKNLKDNLLKVFSTIYEAHRIIKNFIKEKNIENARSLLGDCQDSVLQLGQVIKDSEGDDVAAFGLIEDYCRYLYEVYTNISDDSNGKEIRDVLDKKLYKIEESVKKDIKVKREVVFVPYKASMWDSLESVWKAADADPECDAYVVPIPYYDRKPDHSFGELHYEGSEYPDYVPVTHYNKYNFSARKPDVIYFHNPYDDFNYVTSVDPRFYSSELKKHTDKLVYIPYFVLDEINPDDINSLEDIAHFVLAPGVLNADEVIVQSENMKKAYINVLLNQFGDTEENRKALDKKILGTGSPKFDKIANLSRDDYVLPEEWKRIIYKPDGTRKKVIFYNNSIAALLDNDVKMIEKVCSVFNTFLEYRDDVALLWRPHPLIKATIESMRPHLWEAYQSLVEQYKAGGWGIYDDSADLYRAIAWSDAYYGDMSSVVQLCQKMNIPVMIQNVDAMTDSKSMFMVENL